MLKTEARILPCVGFDFDWIIQFCWVKMNKHAQADEIGSMALKDNERRGVKEF